MKIIRHKSTKRLLKVPNDFALTCIKSGKFTYSTKGAYKRFVKDKRKFENRSKRKDNPQGTRDKLDRLKMMHTWHYKQDKQGKIIFIRPIVSHARNEQRQTRKRNRKSKRA